MNCAEDDSEEVASMLYHVEAEVGISMLLIKVWLSGAGVVQCRM